MLFSRLLIFVFSNSIFSKKNISGIPLVSNSLDPDQARQPDLDPNYLKRSSADDTSQWVPWFI